MLKTTLAVLLPVLLFLGIGSDLLSTKGTKIARNENSGTLEKMIVANGTVTMDLDLPGLGVSRSPSKESTLRFDAERDSFFTVLVFNDEFRGPIPGSMSLIPQNSLVLPGKLNGSQRQLALENVSWGGEADLVVRDAKSGFVFFNVEGQEFKFDPTQDLLNVEGGRLVLTKEYAAELGRPSDAGSVVGKISISTFMRPIEITQIVDGEVKADTLPADPLSGTVPGPDVIVGDLSGLAQFGSADGTRVGLAVGTDSCNFGTIDLNWFANPVNDHPVIPQNLYRMSGGASNNERFEQIGESNVKHAFTALTNNICGLGCNGVGGSHLGSGCSDPYGASLNAGPNLGSRAWINPFTGFYPRNDSATPNNNHTGHAHTGTSHRIIVESADLNTSVNTGATYYAESQYITPHEYAWCQANPTQCNMYNNVSYRQYNVIGTASPFSFSAAAPTQRQKAAVTAWAGSSQATIQPDPGNDGIGIVAYKVTNPSAGVWHYEYAVYNQNLDRAIQSFGVPIGSGASISNIGFHAPPQQPGWTFDGTVNNTGYSNAPWTQTQAADLMTWSSETLAQNPNANAIRWGSMYNFRFDSNRPPQTVNATIGFFKTGAPITVAVQGPSAAAVSFVSVGGQVTEETTGRPISGERVYLRDSLGIRRFAYSNPFGYYFFDNVATGQTYSVGVKSKRYGYTEIMIQVNGSLSNVNLVGQPLP